MPRYVRTQDWQYPKGLEATRKKISSTVVYEAKGMLRDGIIMEILLTFVGFHDPFSHTSLLGEHQAGPILTVVSERRFAKVCLFLTPRLSDQTHATKAAIAERHASIDVEIFDVPLADPTNYLGILRQLRKHFRTISRRRRSRTSLKM